jgi:acyl-coenzyme A synthetase/AMP-(fatty) acid ligase
MTLPDSNCLPVTVRDPASAFARRNGKVITIGAFVAQAACWSEQLPNKPHAINLCKDRYLFAVAFLAAIFRGQCNLLIPSNQAGTIRESLDTFPDAYVVHEGDVDTCGALDFSLSHRDDFAQTVAGPLEVRGEQLAAIVFTSGSTDVSKMVMKTWNTLWLGAQMNRKYFLGSSDSLNRMVATVPPCHMYGLEWSVMLPLIAPIMIYSGNAFFPEDVRCALQEMSGERCLVTTPLHLRAFLKTESDFPAIDRILCATAPLDPELARDAERRFGGTLLEIYGCSEAGSMAYRRPAENPAWRFFDEFIVERLGTRIRISSDHLLEPVDLSDRLEFDEQGRFTLLARHTDLIKVGGKRASLAELNNRLLSIEGVEDGAIFALDQKSENVPRVSALVVSQTLNSTQIRDQLASMIDPVFLPRPLRVVNRLPRSDVGKLRREDLLDAVSSKADSI